MMKKRNIPTDRLNFGKLFFLPEIGTSRPEKMDWGMIANQPLDQIHAIAESKVQTMLAMCIAYSGNKIVATWQLSRPTSGSVDRGPQVLWPPITVIFLQSLNCAPVGHQFGSCPTGRKRLTFAALHHDSSCVTDNLSDDKTIPHIVMILHIETKYQTMTSGRIFLCKFPPEGKCFEHCFMSMIVQCFAFACVAVIAVIWDLQKCENMWFILATSPRKYQTSFRLGFMFFFPMIQPSDFHEVLSWDLFGFSGVHHQK